MKLKVALDYSMSVWMLPGVKSSKMTHWRGIYRQLTNRAVGEKLPENCLAPVNPTYPQASVGLTDECKLPILKTSRYNLGRLTDVSSV